jgi:hypothetical protein
MIIQITHPPRSETLPHPHVYYRRHGIEVTSHQIAVGSDRYRLDELSDIWVGRGALHASVLASLAIAITGTLAGGVIVAHWPSPRVLAYTLAGLAIPFLVGVVCAARWPRHFILIGRYGGARVTILSTRDAQEFGAVRRALCRAEEQLAEAGERGPYRQLEGALTVIVFGDTVSPCLMSQ